MKQFLKKFLSVMVIVMMAMVMNAGEAKAALQANPNTHYYKRVAIFSNWMRLFREMETTGNAMGLNEELEENLTPKESNSIDVHMMRSTEYGAIAILSASGYGNSSNENAITTTTGNKTGVMLNTTQWEYVAGTCTSFSANERYYDQYTGNRNSAKTGDALDLSGWHGASSSDWVTDGYPYFVRGCNGIFSVRCNSTSGDVYYYGNAYGRGVAVCGAGL